MAGASGFGLPPDVEEAEALTTDDLNACWRSGFGPSLSGADKAILASRYGVDVRTVQRWTTMAGQRRNPFPPGLDLADYLLRPDARLGLLRDTLTLCFGLHREEPDCPDPAQYTLHEASVADSLDEAHAMADGEVDPWVSASWVDIEVIDTGAEWILLVTYCRLPSPVLK